MCARARYRGRQRPVVPSRSQTRPFFLVNYGIPGDVSVSAPRPWNHSRPCRRGFQLRDEMLVIRTICCKSAVQDGMAIAGEERHIDEKGKANAEKVAGD